MKKYRLHFPFFLHLLGYAACALCAAVFAATVWRCVVRGAETVADGVQYAVLFLFSLAIPALLLALLFGSKYTVDDDAVVASFVFFRNRYPFRDIAEVIFDRKNCRLALRMRAREGQAERDCVLLLNEAWSRAFIDDLLERNRGILYDETDDFEPGGKKKDGEDENDGK